MYINVLTYYMKQISIREFQLHAEQYLRELPVTLTRYNVPVAVVSPTGVNALSDEELMVKANRGAKTFEKEFNKLETFSKLKEQIENKKIGGMITPEQIEEDKQFSDYINEPELIFSKDDI